MKIILNVKCKCDLNSIKRVIQEQIKRKLVHELLIEIYDEPGFYNYFEIKEIHDKKNFVSGIYTITTDGGRSISFIYNDDWENTLIHELTHAIDFDLFPNWFYGLINKILKKYPRLDYFEYHAEKIVYKILKKKAEVLGI
jgi:hypothetical protein